MSRRTPARHRVAAALLVAVVIAGCSREPSVDEKMAKVLHGDKAATAATCERVKELIEAQNVDPDEWQSALDEGEADGAGFTITTAMEGVISALRDGDAEGILAQSDLIHSACD